MKTKKSVEKIIGAYLHDDKQYLNSILDEEIASAKSKGNYRVAKRLENLKIELSRPSKVGGQSTRTEIIIPSNDLYEYKETTRELSNVVLSVFNRKLIEQWLEEWDSIEKLITRGLHPENKLLLFGPPGTGKTMLANAIANKLNLPLVLVRLDEVISSYLGKTGKNIRSIFDLARSERIVLFLDEIDTIAKHRDDTTELGELKRVVTVLLQNIDDFPDSSILIGATNHEQLLDKAIWRRFNMKINLSLPTTKERDELFDQYLDPEALRHIKIDLLVKLTKGLSGSFIENFVKRINKILILKNKPSELRVDSIKELITLSQGMIGIEKKQKYHIADILHKSGYNLREIEEITGIPYTTLRDNIK